tara:strand:+ start:887 stop:1426 length:540 start_codon:yes stop_codon:yes gene_type:complete
MEECSVCLGPADSSTVSLPGCGHSFHLPCILTWTQRDSRCPVCRRVPEGVRVLTPSSAEQGSLPRVADLEERIDHHRAECRRYNARRRRVLHQQPHLLACSQKLVGVRRSMRRVVDDAQRSYDSKCREVWTRDPEVQLHKGTLRNLRRRELRLEAKLDGGLEELLGPPPVTTLHELLLD